MNNQNGKRNIAVVGTGYWGKHLVRNFDALGALRAICDSNLQVLQAISDQYPHADTMSSFSEVLVDPSIKGVGISTAATAHGTMIREAILSGKDVYVEKPLCLSEAEVKELNALARDPT